MDDQKLQGKSFNITYMGFPPFIEYSEPLGGSDVQTIKLLAEKHDFNFDLVQSKTEDEMVNLVSEEHYYESKILPINMRHDT